MINDESEIEKIEGMTKEITEEQEKIMAETMGTMVKATEQIVDAMSAINEDLGKLLAETPTPEVLKYLLNWLQQLYAEQISDMTSEELEFLLGSAPERDPDKLSAAVREEIGVYMDQNNLQSLTVEEFFRNRDNGSSIYQIVMQRAQKRLNMPGRGEAKSADDKNASIPAPSPLTRPSTFGLSNDKLINRMIDSVVAQVKESDYTGEKLWWWGVNQKSRKEEHDVPLYISSVYMNEPVKTSCFITSEDMAVFDAVCTIIHYLQEEGETGPYYITPEEIWRKENGIVGSKKTPSPKQKQEVRSHMDKMRFTRLILDLRGEITMHRLKINDCRIRKGLVDTYYIEATYIPVEDENDRVYDAYKINEMPFLYSYCAAKNNVLYLDYDLLDTKSTKAAASKDSVYTAGIKRYLMQQIKLMYMRERHNTTILYETIYTASGIPSPEVRAKNAGQAAQEDRKKISEILDSWTERGWILGHEKVKRGKTYTGENIALNPKNFTKEKVSKKE